MYSYVDSQGNEKIYKGTLNGYIAEAPRGKNGFGFDEIFEQKTVEHQQNQKQKKRITLVAEKQH